MRNGIGCGSGVGEGVRGGCECECKWKGVSEIGDRKGGVRYDIYSR